MFIKRFKDHKEYRLTYHDYSSDGYYFVTICTKNRENFFGEIRIGIIALNEIGCIAAKFWQEIPIHFDNFKLNSWVVMPNHVHGVLVIDNPDEPENRSKNKQSVGSSHVGSQSVGSPHGMILRWNGYKTQQPIFNRFGKTNPHSISSVINQFKGAVTRWCKKNGCQNFAWQARFHDRVIRDDDELDYICAYIENNPQKWEEDRNKSENLWM